MSNLKEKIFTRLHEKEDMMIKIRRYLHENPELSFEEVETAKYIADFYKNKKCDIRTNFGGGYGILVDIKGGKPGKTIALRADFDALPIHEETGLEYASKVEGKMHACGHDVHTAYLMGLADVLIELQDEFSGNIRIIHQPAEEKPPGGAKGMVEAGCLDGVDSVFGIHIASVAPTGFIGYREGAVYTGRANFKIEMLGKSGHGSAPHEAKDTIVAASNFVTTVQSLVSRRMNPFDAVSVTIGSFDGRGSANVIKDRVYLEGDVRIMREDMRSDVEKYFRQILDGVCKSFDIDYKLDYVNDYPVVVNDSEMTKFAVKAITEAKIPEVKMIMEIPPATPSEDFAYYAMERPASFYMVGAHKEGTTAYGHHHPKFNVDEDSILICAKSMASIVVEFLKEG